MTWAEFGSLHLQRLACLLTWNRAKKYAYRLSYTPVRRQENPTYLAGKDREIRSHDGAALGSAPAPLDLGLDKPVLHTCPCKILLVYRDKKMCHE